MKVIQEMITELQDVIQGTSGKQQKVKRLSLRKKSIL